MQDKLKILTLEEENALTLEQKEEYYLELRKTLRDTKYRDYNGVQIGFREFANKYIWKWILRKIRKYDLIVEQYENIPKGPVIYAIHHAGIVDGESVVEALPEHAILLSGDDIDKKSRFLLNLIGTVFVSRQDKKSRAESKIELMKALSKGKSIFVFPEATWNMSPNKIHLPLTWGIVDIAKKMGAPIVPVAQEYFYNEEILDGKERIKKVQIRFGEPTYVDINADIKEKLDEFDEKFSTVRWQIWEEQGVFRRKDISNLTYKNYIAGKINSFPNADWSREYAGVYGATSEFYKFHHMNIVPYDENGNMLPTEHVRMLQEISMRQETSNLRNSRGV